MIFFNLDQWYIWDLDGLVSIQHPRILRGKPNPTDIPVMTKRRMPPLAKAVYGVERILDNDHIPTVYASKHAELSRTIGLIRQFGQALSPMNFSMSVNNFIPGLLSVINHNTQAYTVIDSLSGVIEYALLDAFSRLTKSQKIRVVYFEEKTNPMMRDSFGLNDQAVVLAMDISAGQQWQLDFKQSDQKESEATDINGYASLLAGETDSLVVHCRHQKWLWQKS